MKLKIILRKLLKARKDTRKEQKKYNYDDFRWAILEGLQLAYKVTCNSLYGQVGASTSSICLKELAASTCPVQYVLGPTHKCLSVGPSKGGPVKLTHDRRCFMPATMVSQGPWDQ